MGRAVLIAETDAGVRRLVRWGLERCGLTVRVADSGTAALALVADDPDGFFAVVAGELLPGLDGPDLARALTAVRPGIGLFFFCGGSVSSDLFDLPGATVFLKPHGLLGLCEAVAELGDAGGPSPLVRWASRW